MIHWELVGGGDDLETAVLPKGGRSENCSALAMLTPAEGWEGVKRFVLERVKECGGKPCPPVILGIGAVGYCLRRFGYARSVSKGQGFSGN